MSGVGGAERRRSREKFVGAATLGAELTFQKFVIRIWFGKTARNFNMNFIHATADKCIPQDGI